MVVDGQYHLARPARHQASTLDCATARHDNQRSADLKPANVLWMYCHIGDEPSGGRKGLGLDGRRKHLPRRHHDILYKTGHLTIPMASCRFSRCRLNTGLEKDGIDLT